MARERKKGLVEGRKRKMMAREKEGPLVKGREHTCPHDIMQLFYYDC